MKLTPPFGGSDRNFSVDSSRKRKANIVDQQCNNEPSFYGISEPIRGNQAYNQRYNSASKSHDKPGAFSGRNVQGSTLGIVSNLNTQFTEFHNEESQFGQCQFYDLNNYSSSLLIKDGNLLKGAVEKMNNSHGSAQFLSFLHNGSSPSTPLLKSPVAEMPMRPVLQHIPIRNDSNKLQTYPGVHNISMEKDLTSFSLKGGLTFEQRSHSLSGNSSQKLFSSPSDTLESSKLSQHNMAKNQEFHHYGNEDGRTCIQAFNKIGSAIEFKQNGQNSDFSGTRDVSTAGIGCSQIPACTEGKETDGSHQYSKAEVRSGGSSWDTVLVLNVNGGAEDRLSSVACQMAMPEKSSREKTCLEDRKVNTEVQVSTNGEIKIIKKPDESNMENADHFFVKEILPDGADNDNATMKLPEHSDDTSCCSPKFDGKSTLHTGKVASKIIQKLWEGILQLNACTTVSAVAFFKSGEKALEVNWSNLVEVKGKVRLEAFEKYIKELPRSRNRALMVISLCWKLGSSKTGLMGMKEVAKGYINGDKVGFAQPAPGIDLYICPRSDTIITILAKYGFFKGMAAVEDNQDSLIGCVVWRKTRTTSNSLSEKAEIRKVLISEQQLDPPSDSTTLQDAEISSRLTTVPESEENCGVQLMTQPARVSAPLVSEKISPAPGNESMSTKIKDTQVGNDLVKMDNSFTNVIPKLTLLVPDYSPVISVALPTAWKPDSNSLPEPMRCLLKAEIPNMNIVEPKIFDNGLELLEPVVAGPLRMLLKPQKRSVSPDDDDLPEFDFSTACGLSQCPVSKIPLSSNNYHSSDAFQPVKQITVEGLRNSGGPIPPALPIVRPTAAITSQQRIQAPTFEGLATDTHQGIPLPGKLGECDSLVPVPPTSKEKSAGRTMTRPHPIVRTTAAITSQQRSQAPTFGGMATDTYQGVPLPGKLGEHDFQEPVVPIPEEKPAALGVDMFSRPTTIEPVNKAAATQGTDFLIPHKNLWDDDDDMPEWCPPDREHRTQPLVTQTNVSKPASKNVPPRPPLPSNSMCAHPPYLQGFPPRFNLGLLGQHPGSNAVMPQQTRPIAGFVQLAPSYSPGFNPNQPSRPLPFDIKLSPKPLDWRARKP